MRLFALACLFALLPATTACTRSAPEDDYAAAVNAARASKDEMLRTSRNSPVTPSKRQETLPLVYFPPDPSYRVPAALEPAPAASQVMEMPTSTGQRRPMQVMGVLAFTLHGQPFKLIAFAEEGSNGERLFVPFTDATSGHETYAAGRYLDLDRTSTGIYVVDFNTAYNPYCAYNSTYDCPVPPPQNRLRVPIRAGEKVKAHE